MDIFNIGDQTVEYSTAEQLAFLASLEAEEDIGLDDNYCDCASYFLGDHRCSCGNRRVSLILDEYEGKFFLRTEVY